ncbi:MAG TPA: hypothetical protein VK603_10530 [Candidatus Saccharimonadales bacterium]|nr:hypothetical protein [Candidatus Saccharimonadales bacterium]
MKLTAKMLKLRVNKPQTVEDVRAALTAIIEGIRCGAATVAEAEPIKKEIDKRMKKIRAQMKSPKPEDRAALKLFFGK